MNSLVQSKVADAMNPEKYRQAIRRLIGEERRAIMGKRWDDAIKANYQLRLNMELARQTSEIRKGIESFQGKVHRFVNKVPAKKPGEDMTTNANARYAVGKLAAAIGMEKVSKIMERNAQGKSLKDVQSWAAQMSELGLPVMLNYDLYLDAADVSWKDMTVEQFQPWWDEMKMIMGVESARRKVWGVDLAELGDKIAQSIYDHNAKVDTKKVEDKHKLFALLAKVHAEHLKADTIALLLDGNEEGAVFQALINPINQANNDSLIRSEKAWKDMKSLFSAYTRQELTKARQERVFVQSLDGGRGEFITRENAFCALLNCGTNSNRQRLMDGNGWTEDQLKDVLALLDERDYETAQKIWDYLESFKGESFALEEKLTGIKPTAIPPSPVVSPDGKTYRGGYYPVKYNSKKASRGVSPEDRLQGGGVAFPSVEHGSMKERQGGGLGSPLDLRLSVMEKHVADTIHNLAYREAVSDVGRILREGSVKEAIVSTAGIEQYKALQNWLNDVARQTIQDEGSIGKAASWARSHMAAYTMGWKLTTMMAQLTGGLATCVEIGPRWMFQGTGKVFGRGPSGVRDAYKEACDMSPMMRNRITNFEREAASVTRKLMDFGSDNKYLDPVVRIDQWVREHAFVPMGYFQLGVDLPTWYGARAKYLSENPDATMEQAVEYADRIVERTQVGGATKDLAGIQRHGEVAKLMTMYYSYFSCLYNISARHLTMAARERDMPHAVQAASVALLWFIEPVISGVLVNRGPEGDDEGWMEWAAKEAISNPFNTVVGLRDVIAFEKSLLEGKNFGYRISPAVSLIETLGKAAAVPIQVAFLDKEFDDKAAKKIAQGVGMAAGSPLLGAQVINTVSNLWSVLDGSDELRLSDLVFSKNKSHRGVYDKIGDAIFGK